MVFPTFNATKTKDQSKVIKTRDGTDVAARYFVYKTVRGYRQTAATVAGPAWDGRVSGDHFPGG
jgi:hypothetical protein